MERKNKSIILFKAVRKIDGRYFSDYEPEYEYKIDEIHTSELDPDTTNRMGKGLHVNTLDVVMNFGSEWDDMAILVCEIDLDDLLIVEDEMGVYYRTSKLKVLGEK